MLKYEVKFNQHYNSNGETDDYPTDFLYVDGNVIKDADFVEYQGLPENPEIEGYCLVIWVYEIDDEHQNYFENCLDNCQTILNYFML